MTARAWLRSGLAFLAAVQAAVGCWALLLPQSFFALPVVGMGMADNEHLMRDYGAMSLASAVVLGAAAWSLATVLVRAALLMYLVWSVPHFLIHVRLLGHLTPGQGTWLLVLLGAAVALPAALLGLAVRLSRGSPDSLGPDSQPPGRGTTR